MLANLLNKTCEVQSKTLTRDGIGGSTEVWTSNGGYSTRYEKSKQTRVIDDVYKISLDDYLFFFDKDAVIERDDRIYVDSKIFDVISSEKVDGFSEVHHVEVYARYYDHE